MGSKARRRERLYIEDINLPHSERRDIDQRTTRMRTRPKIVPKSNHKPNDNIEKVWTRPCSVEETQDKVWIPVACGSKANAEENHSTSISRDAFQQGPQSYAQRSHRYLRYLVWCRYFQAWQLSHKTLNVVKIAKLVGLRVRADCRWLTFLYRRPIRCRSALYEAIYCREYTIICTC